MTPSSMRRSISDMGSHSTLKAPSLEVFEGKPRGAHGPDAELGKAVSADDVSKLKDAIPIGARAVETRMATLAKESDI